MDFTDSPTICALGSMVRSPRRIRWPSRKGSASSSLIAVCASSSGGCVRDSLMPASLRGIVPSAPVVAIGPCFSPEEVVLYFRQREDDAMKLTAAHLDQFDRDGYLFFPSR